MGKDKTETRGRSPGEKTASTTTAAGKRSRHNSDDNAAAAYAEAIATSKAKSKANKGRSDSAKRRIQEAMVALMKTQAEQKAEREAAALAAKLAKDPAAQMALADDLEGAGGGFYDEEWEQPPQDNVVSIDPRTAVNGAVRSGVILPGGVVAGGPGPQTFINGRPVVYLNPDGTVGNVKQAPKDPEVERIENLIKKLREEELEIEEEEEEERRREEEEEKAKAEREREKRSQSREREIRETIRAKEREEKSEEERFWRKRRGRREGIGKRGIKDAWHASPESNEKKDENKANDQQNNESKQNEEAAKDEKYSVHPKEYYDYQLAGVVVHTGSAEAGHYYSYIRDRVSGEWNEFNDSLIKSFDLKYLDNDCYGGKKKVKSSTNWGGDWEHDQDKIKNAYILVYDRKKYMEASHDEEEKEKKEEGDKKKNDAAALTPQPTADDSKEEQ